MMMSDEEIKQLNKRFTKGDIVCGIKGTSFQGLRYAEVLQVEKNGWIRIKRKTKGGNWAYDSALPEWIIPIKEIPIACDRCCKEEDHLNIIKKAREEEREKILGYLKTKKQDIRRSDSVDGEYVEWKDVEKLSGSDKEVKNDG